MLTQIQFENFRGFRRLSLDGLQSVNLIVGKNNSGKTSFLEGIAVLLNPSNAPEQFARFRQLEKGLVNKFQRGRYSNWVIHDESKDETAKLSGRWEVKQRDVVLSLMDPSDRKAGVVRAYAEKPAKQMTGKQLPETIQSCVVAQQQNPEQLVKSVGRAIVRASGEQLLESALQAIDPRIKRIRTVPTEVGMQVEIDIQLSKSLPISQVGQGPYRLVEILSEIIGADARVAFVDEVETGIHHTCLIHVWRGIAEAAERFKVQVFATTHSHECIEAAHAAFLDRERYNFGIIQLFRESGRIQGRVLDKEKIAAAVAGDIDLRG